MSISTSYDYYKYSQYSNSVSSLWGQQSVSNKQDSKDESSSTLLQLVDNLTEDTSANKSRSPLASLVESGTITSEQEKAIKDALELSRMAHQTQAGAANASKNPLASLVKSGVITEEQETAVMSTLDSARKAHRMMQPPPPPPPQDMSINPMESILEELVDAGKITTEQQESIMSALEEAFESSQTEKAASEPLESLGELAIKAYYTQSVSFADVFQNSFDTSF